MNTDGSPHMKPIPFLAWIDPAFLTLIGSVYLWTLYPYLWWGDEGELITAAWMNGIAHPSGYPLYLLWTKAICFLPLGSIAWRGHLSSAMAALGGLFFLFQLCPVNRDRFWRAIGWRIGLFFFALSPAFWDQAVVTEVYAFSFLLFGASLWFARRFASRPTMTRFCVVCAVAGLAFGHHRLMGLLAPGFALWLAPSLRTVPKWGGALAVGLVVFTLAAVAPYGLLYMRAQGSPPLNWEDPSSLPNLWNVFSAQQFRVDQQIVRLQMWTAFEQGRGPGPFAVTLANLRSAPVYGATQLGLGVFSLPLAIVSLYRSGRRVLWAGAVAVLLPTAFIVQYLVADLATFYLVPMSVLALGMGQGCAFLFDRLGDRLAIGPWILAVVLTVALGFRAAAYETPSEDLARLPSGYAKKVLDNVPDDAVLLVTPPGAGLAPDYVYYPLLYEHEVARRNTFASLVSDGYFTCPWYRTTLEREGVGAKLFDLYDNPEPPLRIREVSLADLRSKGMKAFSSEAQDGEIDVFRVGGRLYFQNPLGLGRLLSTHFLPGLGDRPLYVTSPVKEIEPFAAVAWSRVFRTPMLSEGFGRLDGMPLPAGTLYRARFGAGSAEMETP